MPSTASLQWAVCLTVFMSVLGFSMPAPVLTPLFLDSTQEVFPLLSGLDDVARVWLLGAVVLLYPVGQLLGGPVFARRSDYQGRRPVLLMTLAGVALGYLGMALAVSSGSLLLLVVSRFAAGVFNSNVAIAQAVAADISTEQTKPRIFARLNMAVNLGWVLGPLSGGYVAWHWNDYSLPFFIAMLLVLVNMLMMALWLPAPQGSVKRPDKAVAAKGSRWAVLREPELRPLYVLTLCRDLAVAMYFAYYSVYLVSVFEFGPREIAWSAVGISIPMMAGSWLGARLKKRLSTAQLGVLGNSLMVAGMLSLPLVSELTEFALTLVLTGTGMTLSGLATALTVSDAAPEERQGEAMGMFRTMAVIAELMAVALGSILVMAGISWIFAACAGFALLALLGFRQRLNKAELPDTQSV